MRARGFTLLEVLVAIAIAAIALVALFGAAAATVRTTDALRDRTYAHLVAANLIAELRARETWPALGASTGEATQAGRRWRWHAEVRATDDGSIRRIDVAVDDESGARAGTLVGYLGEPQSRAGDGG